MGLSVSLDIATRALRAQQLGVDVTAHNIANANTPGFSRQELLLVPEIRAGGSLMGGNSLLADPGMGVNASQIRRIRDQFVDFQIREVLQSLGRFEAEARGLEQVEVILNEPSDNGLGNLMANFWNAWRDLSNNPESAAARANVIAQAQTLASAVRRAHDQLRALQRDLDTQVTIAVAQVNRLASQIADLNTQIMRIEVTGNNASDLQDQRDLRLDELSRLVNTTMTTRADGSVSVLVGGRELVAGIRVEKLTTVTEPANLGYRSVRWEADGVAADITAGSLFGLLQARDVRTATPIADLNTLMAEMITQVNAVHAAGFGLDNTTGEDFFTGTNAADVALNATLVANVNKIAAAGGTNLPGDASRALAMADLQAALTMNGNTTTFDDFYNAAIGRLGVAVQEARSVTSNQEFLRSHLDTMRESVAGVSMDEEMTNLIKFQRAFEAAARLISVVDSMLDTLVNRVGLGGR